MPFEAGFPAGHERKGRALLGLQWECLSLGLGLWEGKGCKSLLAVRTCHRTQGELASAGSPGGQGAEAAITRWVGFSRVLVLALTSCCIQEPVALTFKRQIAQAQGEGGRLTSFPSRMAPRRAPSRCPVLSSRPFSSHMERATLYHVPLGGLCLGSPSGHFLNKTKNGLW